MRFLHWSPAHCFRTAASGALLLVSIGCVDDVMPTEPRYDAERQAVIVPASLAAEHAYASIMDAIDRVLLSIDDEVAPGLQVAIGQLADALDQDATGPAADPLLRARAILEAAAIRAGPGIAAELDAIELALQTVEAISSSDRGL